MDLRNPNLACLFGGGEVYVVPSYQRLYVWNQENQWEPLWSDVEDIANGLVRDAVERNLDTVNPAAGGDHFLGTVVLKPSGSAPDLAQQLRIIDGQQRLTTFQILIGAAANELSRRGLADAADRLRELTANSSGSHSLKIKHQPYKHGHDYAGFADVMREATEGDAADGAVGPMADCYRYFQDAIQKWLDSEDQVNLAGSALATTLVTKLRVVGIYLDPHEREHIIFESLNARGEPLTEWDKIKNYLLYKADEAPDLRQEEFFEKYLDAFDDPWWRDLAGRGRQQRPRTDIFADYWLESRKKSSVAVRRVFREFQNYVDGEDQQLEPLIKEFVSDAQYFKTFEERDTSNLSREALFHSRRLHMGAGAIWPLLLQLQRLPVDREERECSLAILESYLVRRMIVGRQARSYDRVSLELLKVVTGGMSVDASLSRLVSDHLSNYEGGGTLWPSDADVKDAVLNKNLYWPAQVLILSAVEEYLRSDMAGYSGLSDSLQIEHIMPHAWRSASWPLGEVDDEAAAGERRDAAIETLGNLTLLKGALNATIGNASWSKKREEVDKVDNLFLNRRLGADTGNEWTEKEIRRRGKWLCGIILEIWPRG